MTVRIEKPAINVREELADLRKPSGVAGEAMLRAETPQEQFQLIGAGRRNLVINGDMRIAQRGTSFTAPTSNTFTLDRWKYEENTANVVNVEQSSDAPAGFERSIKVTTTTAAGSVGSGDFAQLLYKIEGHDLSRLAYGTSDAKTSTISFWVKSSVTGSFPFGLQNHDGTRVFPVTYTVNSANTWEYKTITIAGDTGGTWTTNNNTTGMRFTFLWISGSNFTGGVDGGGWAATTGFANLTSSYTANLDVVNATLQITGVQLELGKVATPFDHPRSYGEEMALCQRYYKEWNYDNARVIGNGRWETSSITAVVIHYPTSMRTSPTWSIDASSNGIQAVQPRVNWHDVSSLNAIHKNGTTSAELFFNMATTAANDLPTVVGLFNSNARVMADAEL